MRLYGNIQKVDVERRMVFGYASTEAVDVHGEIVLKSAIEDALADYLEFANIREMHQLSAVGTAEEASVDDKGLYLGAKIVDDIAWGKVTSGVYKGFSVGGKVLARDKDNKKIITKILLTEISVVDRPSNPEAKFDVWKAAGLRGGDDDDGATSGYLAEVIAERNELAARLAKTTEALSRFAGRVEPLASTVAAFVPSNADLTRRLAAATAAVSGRVATSSTLAMISAGSRRTINAAAIDKRLEQLAADIKKVASDHDELRRRVAKQLQQISPKTAGGFAIIEGGRTS